MSQGHQIGKHFTTLEEPDILYMKLVGDVSNEEVKEINRAHLEYGGLGKHLYYLIDLSELEKTRDTSLVPNLFAVQDIVDYLDRRLNAA